MEQLSGQIFWFNSCTGWDSACPNSHSLLDWAPCVFLCQSRFKLPCPLITDESHLWPSPWKCSTKLQSLNYHLSFSASLCFSVQGIKPWVLHMMGRHSTMELHSQPELSFLICRYAWVVFWIFSGYYYWPLGPPVSPENTCNRRIPNTWHIQFGPQYLLFVVGWH